MSATYLFSSIDPSVNADADADADALYDGQSLKMFSQTTFIELFIDQSKLVFPSGCNTIYYKIRFVKTQVDMVKGLFTLSSQ